MVEHTFQLSIWEEAKAGAKFKVSLVSTINFRTVRATQDLVLKQQQKRTIKHINSEEI